MPIRLTKQHLRCTSGKCRKRFKGFRGDPCPECGKNANVNPWAERKGWNTNVCGCDGYHFPHRADYGKCHGKIKLDTQKSVPDEIYPF